MHPDETPAGLPGILRGARRDAAARRDRASLARRVRCCELGIPRNPLQTDDMFGLVLTSSRRVYAP